MTIGDHSPRARQSSTVDPGNVIPHPQTRCHVSADTHMLKLTLGIGAYYLNDNACGRYSYDCERVLNALRPFKLLDSKGRLEEEK